MYTKDKSQRITLRLNEEQFEFVKQSADMLGVSPSEFLRMVVNVSMSAALAQMKKQKGEGERRENEEAREHNIVQQPGVSDSQA